MPYLYSSQAAAQRAILRSVGKGYPLWTAGTVRAEKWQKLIAKFEDAYEIDLSPAARQQRKRRGMCSARLIAAELPASDRGEWIRWVLLVTDHGAGIAKERERLNDARDGSSRLVWGDYVCMHLTRPRVHGGGSRWTWCLAPQVERQEGNYLTAVAQAAAKQRDAKRLISAMEPLSRRPMHSGVRTQVAKMIRRSQKVWRKHSNGAPWPALDPADLPAFGAFR